MIPWFLKFEFNFVSRKLWRLIDCSLHSIEAVNMYQILIITITTRIIRNIQKLEMPCPKLSVSLPIFNIVQKSS